MRRLVIAIAVAIVLDPVTASAADYFVKNGGNNALDGLSPATAWATLGYAAGRVNPGDTVHVQDGSYQGFYLSRSGTAGNPITFRAAGTNVQITADNGITPDGINVEGAEHVVIDGFIVNNRTRAGIRTALSRFVTVRNCRAGYNGRWGIFSGFADDFTVEFNETHHSQLEHGIYVSNSGDRPIIRGNLVHNNHAAGIHMNGDVSQGGDGTISNALVERNVIYGNGVGGGSGINMDGVSDSVVRNNLLYDNHASGISLYRIDGAAGSSGNLVINNTIVNASDARWCVNISGGSTGNTLRNNILYNHHSFRGVIIIDTASRPGFSSDDNSLMSRFSLNGGSSIVGFAAWQAEGYDTHSFLATPADLFVTPGADFRLRPGSPALDTGTAAGAPASDVEGNPRPVGTGYDVGAYETQLETCGNGTIDPDEQCGEPGLACSDACTQCAQCVCAATDSACGDGMICGAEACEGDGDCAAGQTCDDCTCVTPPVCASGIAMQTPRLRIRVTPFLLRLSGKAVIPKPWTGVDPVAHGVRVVVEGASGSERFDVTVPPGARVNGVGWSVNPTGTRWTYRDRLATQGPVTQVTLTDQSRRTDGLLTWKLQARSADAGVPDATAVRTSVVAGAPGECAHIDWNAPGAPRPRCDRTSRQLVCR